VENPCLETVVACLTDTLTVKYVNVNSLLSSFFSSTETWLATSVVRLEYLQHQEVYHKLRCLSTLMLMVLCMYQQEIVALAKNSRVSISLRVYISSHME
jgi:hypothetical protein